jgi:hypothetical protein
MVLAFRLWSEREEEMSDNLTTERRLVEAALLRILARALVGSEALAPLVEACAEGEADWAAYRGEPAEDPVELAFAVNAGGLEDQVRFILDHFGLDEGERRLMRLAWPESAAAA